MDTTKIAGLTAAVAGLALLVLMLVMAVAGPGFAAGMGAGYPGSGGDVSMMGQGARMMGGHMGGHGSTGTAGAAAIPGATEVTITAADLSFSPGEIRLPAGRDVNLTLINRGQVLHDLTIPGLGVHVVAEPGEQRTVGLRDLAPGRYAGFCSVPGHADAGMRATVVVE
jgi:uncharacterized cupredoxin-like copper-binding protein